MGSPARPVGITYQNCLLPTPEDRLLFILTYLKTYSLQVVQGRLFGMDQSKANQWLPPACGAAGHAAGLGGCPLVGPCRRWPSVSG